jgi:hypothetical protein
MTYTVKIETGDLNGKAATKTISGLPRASVKLVTSTFKTVLECQFQTVVLASYLKDGESEKCEFVASINGQTDCLGTVEVIKE